MKKNRKYTPLRDLFEPGGHSGSGVGLWFAIAIIFAPHLSFPQTCPNPDAYVPVAGDFAVQTIIPANTLDQPITMTIARDGRVFAAQRDGVIYAYVPAVGWKSDTAAALSVYLYTGGAYDMGGLWGMALSPSFASDGWIYVYYPPLSLWNGKSDHSGRLTYRLSRFQVTSANKLNAASEQVLLTVAQMTETHNGGSLKFGKNGDLYLSTGDNHRPGCGDAYPPTDENDVSCDDGATTANTDTLLGKVLRIHPESNPVDGKYYTVPAGNLFPDKTPKVRPEIYTMGHRNPFKIYPDPVTGRLYIPMFGPGNDDDPVRGPKGGDVVEVTDAAANFGYPYFLKRRQSYCHWDYQTKTCTAVPGQTGVFYDPDHPINSSKNNTGIINLPPVSAAVMWQGDSITGVGGCGWGAGEVYHFDASLQSADKFPPYFNNKWLLFDIAGVGNHLITMNPPPAPIASIAKKQIGALPWGALGTFSGNIMEMLFGPGDGALYVLDYGAAFYAKNGNASLKKITYKGCLPSPVLAGERKLLSPNGGFHSLIGRSVTPPLGTNKAQVFNLAGKRIFEMDVRPENPGRIDLPENGTNMLWVIFR